MLKARNGREITMVKILLQADDYIVYLFCPEVDGFCNPERVDVNLYSRTQTEPTAEVLEQYEQILKSLCFVHGDVIQPVDARTYSV